jgi:hypothetical protein
VQIIFGPLVTSREGGGICFLAPAWSRGFHGAKPSQFHCAREGDNYLQIGAKKFSCWFCAGVFIGDPVWGTKRVSIGMTLHRLSERRTTADPSTSLGMTTPNKGHANAGFVRDDTSSIE